LTVGRGKEQHEYRFLFATCNVLRDTSSFHVKPGGQATFIVKQHQMCRRYISGRDESICRKRLSPADRLLVPIELVEVTRCSTPAILLIWFSDERG
jgi:hypothetical protein